MDKNSFLNRLSRALSSLPQEERKERLAFYEEMIDDRMEEGLSEEEAVASLGSIEELVGKVYLDIGVSQPENTAKTHGAGTWILLILALPLLIAVFSVVFSLYAALWSVVISLWAAEVSLVACVPAFLIFGVIQLVLGKSAAGLVMLGAALVLAGLAIFFFFGCHYATKGSAWLTKWLAGQLKKMFTRGGRQNG